MASPKKSILYRFRIWALPWRSIRLSSRATKDIMTTTPLSRPSLALLTDLYQLTMAGAYWPPLTTDH